MALEYDKGGVSKDDWQEFLLILDDYTEWFHSLLQFLYYPEANELSNSVKMPTSIKDLLVKAKGKEEIQPEVYQKMRALYKELSTIADSLVKKIKKTGRKPSTEDFKSFLAIYEEFMLYVRRQEIDAIKSDAGYDPFTGLRSKRMLVPELERELQRLERQGKAFCVSLVKIHDFEEIKKSLEPEEIKDAIKVVADLIKLSLRAFDDAYYTDECEFVLCLKQADMAGGVSALERLRNQLEKKNITVDLNDGSNVLLKLSCCISEPVSGDKADGLISNLREDLSTLDSDGEDFDAVLQYVELSPLERFVRDGLIDDE